MERLIKAFDIFIKYTDNPYPVTYEHDVMRVLIEPDSVSTEDKYELSLLGFEVNEDMECFEDWI